MGHDVTCVDVDEKKVKLMESGISPIYEADLEELMQKNYAAGRLHYTVDYKNAYKDADAIFTPRLNRINPPIAQTDTIRVVHPTMVAPMKCRTKL